MLRLGKRDIIGAVFNPTQRIHLNPNAGDGDFDLSKFVYHRPSGSFFIAERDPAAPHEPDFKPHHYDILSEAAKHLGISNMFDNTEDDPTENWILGSIRGGKLDFTFPLDAMHDGNLRQHVDKLLKTRV